MRKSASGLFRRRSKNRFAGLPKTPGWKVRWYLDKVKNGKGAAFGFNAATEEYEDLVKAGIVDPTKVVRTALQNAASVAGMMITTEAMIADKPEKKKDAPAMPHDHEDY